MFFIKFLDMNLPNRNFITLSKTCDINRCCYDKRVYKLLYDNIVSSGMYMNKLLVWGFGPRETIVRTWVTTYPARSYRVGNRSPTGQTEHLKIKFDHDPGIWKDKLPQLYVYRNVFYYSAIDLRLNAISPDVRSTIGRACLEETNSLAI